MNLEYYIGEEEKLTHTIMGHKRINPVISPTDLYELICGVSTFFIRLYFMKYEITFWENNFSYFINMYSK